MAAQGFSMSEEVTRSLADTIGVDVERQMEAMGWSEGATPLPLPVAGPDNPAAVAASTGAPGATTPAADNPPAAKIGDASQPAAPATGIDWESLRDPKNGMILGKYANEGEAVKGVGHAVRMAKDALASKADVDAENARLRSELALRSTSPAPVMGATSQSTPLMPTTGSSLEMAPSLAAVLARVKEDPILDEESLQALVSGISDQSALVARKAVREVISEQAHEARTQSDAWNAVDEFMKEQHPASLAFTDEIGLFSQTNPYVGTVVQTLVDKGLRKEAAVFAWNEFAKVHGAEVAAGKSEQAKEVQLEAAGQVRREAVDEARRNAGVIPSAASGVHETSAPGASQTEIDEAARAMKSSGHGMRWRSLTIGRDLTGPLFEQG